MNTFHHLLPFLVSALVTCSFACSGCSGQQQTKTFGGQLTSSDSLILKMGQWDLIRYHSVRLGFDINYPAFLVRQDLEDEASQQELFMADDVSISVMVDSVDNMTRSPGQQFFGMGAELLETTERYSLHEGADEDWEYYGKVIDDSLRIVTVILRYFPEHAEAVEPLREWVKAFDVMSQ